MGRIFPTADSFDTRPDQDSCLEKRKIDLFCCAFIDTLFVNWTYLDRHIPIFLYPYKVESSNQRPGDLSTCS